MQWADVGLLVVTEELLVQLLTLAQAREPDGRRAARDRHELAREIDDADRLSHVEHQDLTRRTDHRGLDHELDRLRDGHEEARDLRMGDGDRRAGRQLLGEGRDHRTPAAEHVAEPHRHVPAGHAGRGVGDQPLTDPLRPAQHAGRVGGLVRGDVDEGRHPGRLGGVEDIAGAQDVRLPGLRRVLLQHREVLERRCVEHDVRAAVDEDVPDDHGVADVGEHDVGRVEERVAVDRELDGVQGGLVAVEHDQLGRG